MQTQKSPSPLLSIITVNLNNAEGLRKTLDSVAAQNFTNYEHLIIDGGSTDGSMEVIKKYEKQFNGIENGLYWVSEPDKGVYNAMNKGIKVAKGEYCLFLNSGDWFMEKYGLQTVFSLNPQEDICYCDLQLDNSHCIRYPDQITLNHFLTGTIGHPSSLIKTSLLHKLKGFNEKYQIIADWEFFIRAIIINKCTYKHFNNILTFFSLGGISTNTKYEKIHKEEKKSALYELFPMMAEDYFYLNSLEQELSQYRNSRLIQLIKRVQNSTFYKTFQHLFFKLK